MKTKLKSLGFDVIHEQENTRHEMLSALQQLIDQMNGDNLSDVVFYYAGHGCSIREYNVHSTFFSSKQCLPRSSPNITEGRNCLIPIDGLNASNPDFATPTYVELNWIIENLSRSRRSETVPIIIILDCCRSEITTTDGESDERRPRHG